jgi:alpha-galactosidase
MRKFVPWCCCLMPLLVSLAAGMDDAEIPLRAPDDAVMASPAEVQVMSDWALAAFTGGKPAGDKQAVKIDVRRQDHGAFRFGESCIETPMKIGGRAFRRGLGTHATSVIAVGVPAGAQKFQAEVGIDNNYDTQGRLGTVQFAVEIAGKEVLRTATIRGGQEPLPIDVAIPAGVQEIVLKVDTTNDGPGHDQADWGDARFLLDGGKTVWLEGANAALLASQVPFSFRYGNAASADLLKSWKRTVQTTADEDRTRHDVAWSDPATGLRVTAAVSVFKRYPAVEWVLYFENQGTKDTPILQDIQALDVSLATMATKMPVVLHQLVGDVCGERSFLPMETPLEPGKSTAFAPNGGRPSNGATPFFNVQYGGRGLIAAIGWSGQWAASLARAEAGPTRLVSGMEKTHLKLLPGEKIRGPRILLLGWQGDRQVAHNRFRRLLLFHYVPKLAGRPLRLPVAGQCFDRYWQTRPLWDTVAEQIAFAKVIHKAGCNTYWFDAAWFEGGFPNGVGNWFPKPKRFPEGMRPVGDAVHAMGMQFILWFEPERVAPGSKIAKEHPEFVFGGAGGGLFKLSDPAARKYMTDLLSERIKLDGVDVYRNDFNIDPLDFWRKNDAPDRQGITEIRYVEGHYAMWDELRARHPGLWIDNCASGGRRIDLETCMRSVPLWRSDTSCWPGHPEWDQTQTYGLAMYVPLFTACGWSPDAYTFRSSATGGAIVQFDFLNPEFPQDQGKAALDEAKQNQKYWYGDFYPLCRAGLGHDAWAAYQFHRADLNAGIVLAFRRGDCAYLVLEANLQAIDPAARYRVEFLDEARQKTEKLLTGKDLASLELRIPKRQASLLIRYEKQ